MISCFSVILSVGSLANGGYDKGESGTYRLIRTICISVQTKCCEKSGRIGDFASFLVEVGFTSVPLIPFKGNKFNVLFYNGCICYFLHEHLKAFLMKSMKKTSFLRQYILIYWFLHLLLVAELWD